MEKFWEKCGVNGHSDDVARTTPTANNNDDIMRKAYAECLRSEAYNGLRKTLSSQCKDKYPSMCFERWAISAKERERLDGLTPLRLEGTIISKLSS
jgi:hypothetical protein